MKTNVLTHALGMILSAAIAFGAAVTTSAPAHAFSRAEESLFRDLLNGWRQCVVGRLGNAARLSNGDPMRVINLALDMCTDHEFALTLLGQRVMGWEAAAVIVPAWLQGLRTGITEEFRVLWEDEVAQPSVITELEKRALARRYAICLVDSFHGSQSHDASDPTRSERLAVAECSSIGDTIRESGTMPGVIRQAWADFRTYVQSRHSTAVGALPAIDVEP